MLPDNCTCGRVKVGGEDTGSRNWSDTCPAHGLDSAWWNSAAQKKKRAKDSERLRELQRQAREARARARERDPDVYDISEGWG